MISNALMIEWKLPQFLESSAIEDWIGQLPSTTKTVVVRLGSWKHIGPFADARLQGALCLLHRNGVKTIASVPPVTLTGDRGKAAFAEREALQHARSLTPTERRLAGSIAGLSIGQLCTFEEKHKSIPELQKEALKRRHYLFGWGSELALAVPVEEKPTGFPRKAAPIRASIFNNRLRDLLDPFGISPAQASPYWFNDLKAFAFEASENTWEHGRLDFKSRPIRSIRFVRVRRIDVGKSGFDFTKVAPDHKDRFGDYLKALSAAKDLASIWTPSGGRLVEVTIADGGVGIAAKMAGSFSVFEGSLETEKKHLLDALLPGKTTKNPSEPGRGQGFRKMLQSCFRRSGFMQVRTGRLSFSRTYRNLDGSNESADFNNPDSLSYIPKMHQMEHPVIAGTSVSLMFPITSPHFVDKSSK